MKEFKFVMNEYRNVCYVYVDVNKPPIDTMYLTQNLERNKPHEAGEIKSGWTPQCFQIKNILNFRTASIEKMKNFYNEFYDEIYDTFFPKDLLKFPEVISGYYVSNIVGGIMASGEVREKDRVGVAYSGEQAKGIQAFCELSQILPIFNEGWNPDWSKNYEKWCIKTTNLGINVTGYNHIPHFLSFQTKKKAELFLKEKIDLITDLSNARII